MKEVIWMTLTEHHWMITECFMVRKTINWWMMTLICFWMTMKTWYSKTWKKMKWPWKSSSPQGSTIMTLWEKEKLHQFRRIRFQTNQNFKVMQKHKITSCHPSKKFREITKTNSIKMLLGLKPNLQQLNKAQLPYQIRNYRKRTYKSNNRGNLLCQSPLRELTCNLCSKRNQIPNEVQFLSNASTRMLCSKTLIATLSKCHSSSIHLRLSWLTK